jgi:hypothetical protein
MIGKTLVRGFPYIFAFLSWWISLIRGSLQGGYKRGEDTACPAIPLISYGIVTTTNNHTNPGIPGI